MKWPTVLTFKGAGKMLFVKPLRRKYNHGWVAQWPRMRHSAELLDNLPDDGGRRHFFFFFFLQQGVRPALDSLLQQSWSKPSRPACLAGTLHPFLMSPVGTPSGEGCLSVCPRGRGEMGHRDALKLWLAPRVKKGLIRSAPWGLAQYTAPKWMSSSPLFPLLAVHTSATALISTLLVALLFKPSALVHSAGTRGISVFTPVIPASLLSK